MGLWFYNNCIRINTKSGLNLPHTLAKKELSIYFVDLASLMLTNNQLFEAVKKTCEKPRHKYVTVKILKCRIKNRVKNCQFKFWNTKFYYVIILN